MCGGLYGCTTSTRDLSFIFSDCADAGIPEVLLQRSAVGGACVSMSAHRDCLKGRFSGPDSWMMVAFWSAEGRSWAMVMEDSEESRGLLLLLGVGGKKDGSVDWTY